MGCLIYLKEETLDCVGCENDLNWEQICVWGWET